MGIELEVFNDLPDIGRESLDVVDEVGFDVVRVVQKLIEVKAGFIGEAVASDAVEDCFYVGDLGLVEDGLLGIGKNTVEAAQDRHGQDDVTIFFRPVGTAEQFGDFPDEVDFGTEVVHGRCLAFIEVRTKVGQGHICCWRNGVATAILCEQSCSVKTNHLIDSGL